MSEFHSFYKLIANNTDFIPHYVANVSDLEIPDNEKPSNCVAKGKYCLLAYPNPTNKNGKILINEGLFHQCVYEASKMKNDHLNSFFGFISNFKVQCSTVIEGNIATNCGRTHLSTMGIDELKVSKCVSSSSEEGDADNLILKTNTRFAQKHTINHLPFMIINTKKIYGALNVQNIFHIVCSSFTDQPIGCKEYYRPTTSSSFGWFQITLIILATLLANVFIIYICRRYIQNRLKTLIEDNPLDLQARIQKSTSDYYSLQTQTESTKF